MSDLEKHFGGELQPQIQNYLVEQLGVDGIQIGDVFIDAQSHGVGVKITNITFTDDERYKDSDMGYKVIISYKEIKDWDFKEWEEEEQSTSFNSFRSNWLGRGKRIKVGENLTDLRDKALKLISGEEDVEILDDDSVELNTETALINKNSKDSLNQLQKSLEDRKNQAEIIKAFVSIEMEKKKREMDVIRRKLEGVVAIFQKKIQKIMRVITTIELYLGIDEELFQIQEGQLAPADTPISFRQAVLYMDEEVGVYQNGGLDFTDINWFDEWLVTDNHYKTLLPEEKGLVVFRPRRFDKNYNSGDPFGEALKNRENRMRTYLLIRNGECLYRVYTENIVILPRLFPKRTELQKLMDEINKENLSSWSEEKKQENVEDLVYQYKKRAILLQGLVDRTEVFHPLPVEKVNIFDMSNLDGMVNFIYDDEATLPSGRLSFWDWHKVINSKIEKGSRVLVTGFDRYDIKHRIYYYCNEHNVPDPPSVGIYEVEEYLEKRSETMKVSDFEKQKKIWDELGTPYEVITTYPQRYCINFDKDNDFKNREYEDGVEVKSTFSDLTILYNPKDTVYGGWGSYEMHDRKKRVRIRIEKTDRSILNYDQISLDDIDFYRNSRVDRPNYLGMLPLLNDIKQWRLDEMKNEKFFSQMVYAQVYKFFSGKTEEYVYDLIGKTIDWWKFKNMWKRPIDKDDAKALRMIVKKIKNEN